MDHPDLQVNGIQQNTATMSVCQGGVLDLTALYSTVSLITIWYHHDVLFCSQFQESKILYPIFLTLLHCHVYLCHLAMPLLYWMHTKTIHLEIAC